MNEQHLAILRRHMVEVVVIHFAMAYDALGKSELDPKVEEAMLEVPRHLFVPAQLAAVAYHDTPLPLGFDKTVSQPFIGGLMVDLLEVRPGDRVLEIGTGLGYQAALLGELGAEVWTVEIVEEFAAEAAMRLLAQGYVRVTLRVGDGSKGWPEHAPYDRILVTAAASEVPQTLSDQLKPGGRMVLPVGPAGEAQQLSVVEKKTDGTLVTHEIMAVRFTQLETMA